MAHMLNAGLLATSLTLRMAVLQVPSVCIAPCLSMSTVAYLDAKVEALEAEVAVRVASYDVVAFVCGGCSGDYGGGEREENSDSLHVVWVFDSVVKAVEGSRNECGVVGVDDEAAME